MSGPRDEPDGLSEEEIRELLRDGLAEGLVESLAGAAAPDDNGDGDDDGGGDDDDGAGAGDRIGGREEAARTEEDITFPASRVLLVTRRGADVDLVGGRLRARGATVELVRNPFTALDKLRTGSYGAVVSDLGLWANGGSLLLDRIRHLELRLPVLFLADEEQKNEAPPRPRSPVVRGVLRRPLRPAQVELALADLFSRETGEAPDGGRTTLAPPPERAPREPESAPARERQAARRKPEPARPPVPELAEVPWLRFIVKCGRLARAAPDPAAVAKLAGEELGARAVGLLVAGEEGQSARLELHGGAEPALLQAIVEASARRSVEGTEVCVRFDAGGRRGWLVLLGLAPEVGAAYGAYREDVQHSLACSLDAESPRRRASGG